MNNLMIQRVFPRSASLIAAAVAAVVVVGCTSTKTPQDNGLATSYPTPGFDKAYYVNAYRPTNPDNVSVKVSLANQAIYVLEGDRPLMVTACTVGTPRTPTPKGKFTIRSKQKHRRRQSQPDRGYPMGYWCEFYSPAYGIHAGWVHSAPRSHGCIRIHFNAAPKFFNLVKVGTPLHIADSQPALDSTIGKNIPRPRDATALEFPPNIKNTDEVFNLYKGPLYDG